MSMEKPNKGEAENAKHKTRLSFEELDPRRVEDLLLLQNQEEMRKAAQAKEAAAHSESDDDLPLAA